MFSLKTTTIFSGFDRSQDDLIVVKTSTVDQKKKWWVLDVKFCRHYSYIVQIPVESVQLMPTKVFTTDG